jgi:hypothetical protein
MMLTGLIDVATMRTRCWFGRGFGRDTALSLRFFSTPPPALLNCHVRHAEGIEGVDIFVKSLDILVGGRHSKANNV